MDMWRMMNAMKVVNNCSKKANELYNDLRNSDELKKIGIIFPKEKFESYAFLLYFPKGSLVKSIYISVPPKIKQNFGEKYDDDEQSIFEVILVNDRGNFFYNEKIGYSDNRKFNNIESLISEIVRLSEYLEEEYYSNDITSDEEYYVKKEFFYDERESLKYERKAIEAEREALKADRKAIEAEREALEADRKAIEAEWKALKSERKALDI